MYGDFLLFIETAEMKFRNGKLLPINEISQTQNAFILFEHNVRLKI